MAYRRNKGCMETESKGSINSVDVINRDLTQICHWSQEYGLSVNTTKTQVIIEGRSRLIRKINSQQIPVVCCNGSVVPYSEKVKNLGIYMDRYLSWGRGWWSNPQIILQSLQRLRNFLPTNTKIALAQSLLLTILDCYMAILALLKPLYQIRFSKNIFSS